MKLHLIMYLINIAQDIKHFIKNFNLTNKTKFILYSSDIVEKIQLSVEMIIEMVYGKNKDVDLFAKKKYFLLILELLREGFRLRELKKLSEFGFDFYIEKSIYLNNVLEISEEDYENRLSTMNQDHFFQIQNKTSKKMMLTTDKIEIPQKILDKLNSVNLTIENFNVKNNVKNDMDSKFSIWNKLKLIIQDYYNFFSRYLLNKVNIIEILYIIRPLIYLSLMTCFKRKSFIPLMVNAIFDFFILNSKRSEENFDSNKAFAFEYMHRLGRLSVYFLREPIFSLITKPFLKKLMKILRLPQFIVDLLLALLTYYTNIYFIL